MKGLLHDITTCGDLLIFLLNFNGYSDYHVEPLLYRFPWKFTLHYKTNNAILNISCNTRYSIIITLALQVSGKGVENLSTTQMLKGIIDGCLLAIIKDTEVYGYEMAEKLESYGFHSFSEGTIYPLLLRMQKEELVRSTLKKSTAGPRRKYYSLTPKGELELNKFIERWNNLQSNVNKVLHCESDTEYTKGDEIIE